MDKKPKTTIPPKKPTSGPFADQDDPFLYASLLTSLFQEGAIFRFLSGDFNKMTNLILYAGKNRKQAQAHIEKLQGQVRRVEDLIAQSQIKTTGQHLDKLR